MGSKQSVGNAHGGENRAGVVHTHHVCATQYGCRYRCGIADEKRKKFLAIKLACPPEVRPQNWPVGRLIALAAPVTSGGKGRSRAGRVDPFACDDGLYE